MIELTVVKGGAVWVNPAQLQYVALPDAAASSMYGDSNNRAGARLYFAQGVHLDVRESPADVVALDEPDKACVPRRTLGSIRPMLTMSRQ